MYNYYVPHASDLFPDQFTFEGDYIALHFLGFFNDEIVCMYEFTQVLTPVASH